MARGGSFPQSPATSLAGPAEMMRAVQLFRLMLGVCRQQQSQRLAATRAMTLSDAIVIRNERKKERNDEVFLKSLRKERKKEEAKRAYENKAE